MAPKMTGREKLRLETLNLDYMILKSSTATNVLYSNDITT
jgi:hypothetical protein